MATTARKRILYYCQSLVGIGHIACSLRITRELLRNYDVDFIQGGRVMEDAISHPGFRNLTIPALLIDENTGELYDPDGGRNTEALWAERQQAMAGFLRWPYAAVVVEFFPFGRRRFKREINGLLQTAREHSGDVPVFCSVREILVPADSETERRIVQAVKADFHTVFVRCDPAVVRLDETFALAGEVEDQLCYTGYVCPPAPQHWLPRRNRILVSQGGGDVGRALLEAALAVAPSLPQYEFLLAAGARTSAEHMTALRQLATSGNVRIEPFLADFPRQLQESALSISMGGDNTLLDVITTRTPALAFPYQGNSEQSLRIAKFAEQGLIHALQPDDLAPERLLAKILTALQAPYPEARIAVDGANVTCERIRAIVEANQPTPI